MNGTRHHYNQNLFSKWLLIAVLFLSFFKFAVTTRQSSIKPEVQQTTLLVGNPIRFVKSIIFNSTLQLICNRGVASFFLVAPQVNLILLHSGQIHTRLEIYSGAKFAGIINGFFYRAKTISPNTRDDPASSLG
jgi:hypothetical protein